MIWEDTLRFSSALVSYLHFCDTLNNMSHHSSTRVCLTNFIRKSLQSFIPDSSGKWCVGRFSVRTSTIGARHGPSLILNLLAQAPFLCAWTVQVTHHLPSTRPLRTPGGSDRMRRRHWANEARGPTSNTVQLGPTRFSNLSFGLGRSFFGPCFPALLPNIAPTA